VNDASVEFFVTLVVFAKKVNGEVAGVGLKRLKEGHDLGLIVAENGELKFGGKTAGSDGDIEDTDFGGADSVTVDGNVLGGSLDLVVAIDGTVAVLNADIGVKVQSDTFLEVRDVIFKTFDLGRSFGFGI
jgi:hypothetical protein